jgi:hypothetical protein
MADPGSLPPAELTVERLTAIYALAQFTGESLADIDPADAARFRKDGEALYRALVRPSRIANVRCDITDDRGHHPVLLTVRDRRLVLVRVIRPAPSFGVWRSTLWQLIDLRTVATAGYKGLGVFCRHCDSYHLVDRRWLTRLSGNRTADRAGREPLPSGYKTDAEFTFAQLRGEFSDPYNRPLVFATRLLALLARHTDATPQIAAYLKDLTGYNRYEADYPLSRPEDDAHDAYLEDPYTAMYRRLS